MFLRLHFLIIIQHEHNSNVFKNAFSFHENNRCIKTCLHPPARENICETNNFRFKTHFGYFWSQNHYFIPLNNSCI